MADEKQNGLDPQEYFDYIKSKKEQMTDDFLKNLYAIITKQISKAMITGQNLQVRRLAYSLGVLKREHELLQMGLDVFILRDNIDEYINTVADKAVKVVELEFYPREIPDEIVEKVQKLKENKLFDNYYVVFTDYTGETTKEVTKERMRRDPILFGAFEHKVDNMWNICDRFYFIGDWEDEYCDLTLSKMVQAMAEKGKTDIVNTLSLPKVTEEAVRDYVNRLDETQDSNRLILRPQSKVRKSFFNKVRTAFKELLS